MRYITGRERASTDRRCASECRGRLVQNSYPAPSWVSESAPEMPCVTVVSKACVSIALPAAPSTIGRVAARSSAPAQSNCILHRAFQTEPPKQERRYKCRYPVLFSSIWRSQAPQCLQKIDFFLCLTKCFIYYLGVRTVNVKRLCTMHAQVFGALFWKHRAESNCRLSFSRGKRRQQRLAD